MTQQEFNDISARYVDYVSAAQWSVIAQMGIEDIEELVSRLNYYAETNAEV
jgi:hypothetical protein